MKLTRGHIGIAVLPSFWLGTLFALVLGYEFNVFTFILGFFIIFFIFASAAYINDYYDFTADQYNRQFGFSGGSGVLQKYPELKEITKYLAFGFIFISFSLSIFLAWTTFIPWWSIGYIAIGGFFSWFYSAPPIRLSYRGIGEIPHFIAGLMNAGWGYILVTGAIDINLIVFAIPLALHLLNVILIFEIPDREADIHGGKTNFIVNHGRKKSFLLISMIFWIATCYYIILANYIWYASIINFWFIALLSCVPSIISTYTYFKNEFKHIQSTKLAIQNALSLFTFSIFILVYFLILQF